MKVYYVSRQKARMLFNAERLSITNESKRFKDLAIECEVALLRNRVLHRAQAPENGVTYWYVVDYDS